VKVQRNGGTQMMKLNLSVCTLVACPKDEIFDHIAALVVDEAKK
jgi:hypothetical protein